MHHAGGRELRPCRGISFNLSSSAGATWSPADFCTDFTANRTAGHFNIGIPIGGDDGGEPGVGGGSSRSPRRHRSAVPALHGQRRRQLHRSWRPTASGSPINFVSTPTGRFPSGSANQFSCNMIGSCRNTSSTWRASACDAGGGVRRRCHCPFVGFPHGQGAGGVPVFGLWGRRRRLGSGGAGSAGSGTR